MHFLYRQKIQYYNFFQSLEKNNEDHCSLPFPENTVQDQRKTSNEPESSCQTKNYEAHPSCSIEVPSVITESRSTVAEAEISKSVNNPKTMPTSSAPKQRKRCRPFTVPEHIDRTIKTLKSLKEDVANREPADEFTYFAQNVACQLRQLPIQEALQCQSDIMNLLLTRRVQCANQTSASSSSTYTNMLISPDLSDSSINTVILLDTDETSECFTSQHAEYMQLTSLKPTSSNCELDSAIQSITH